ncbi:MAG: alpha-glucosidase C-terminal domain-containing protein, partial [bacterium]
LSQGQTEFLNISNDHVFAYIRHQDSQRLLLLCNFTERSQSVSLKELRVQGFSDQAQDLLTSQTLQLAEDLYLAPYQTYWLQTKV